MSYQSQIHHNYHELNRVRKLRYWLSDRNRFPVEKRFFFEGCRRLPGQMYIADRKALYDAIIKYKPTSCFEIGTCTGGGSTFFLASAFAKLGRGTVITLEADESLYNLAKSSYQRVLPELLPFIEFIKGNSPESFLRVVECNKETVECFFLDGSDDSAETVEQYEFFKQFLRSGSIMMAHDWNTQKMVDVKSIVKSDTRWSIELELDEPESVGFVVCLYH